jgi:hypothetical protein
VSGHLPQLQFTGASRRCHEENRVVGIANNDSVATSEAFNVRNSRLPASRLLRPQ